MLPLRLCPMTATLPAPPRAGRRRVVTAFASAELRLVHDSETGQASDNHGGLQDCTLRLFLRAIAIQRAKCIAAGLPYAVSQEID